jgi:uncharacterized protein YndB with AHSA1/START domain
MSADETKVVSAERAIEADVATVFELIANPARQPEWDGNDNLAVAVESQRVRAVGDMFVMTLTMGAIRENHVVEFEVNRCIAWTPAEPSKVPPGHLWRWELTPVNDSQCIVKHTYDWTQLRDEARFERARATTGDWLASSIDRLANLAELGG